MQSYFDLLPNEMLWQIQYFAVRNGLRDFPSRFHHLVDYLEGGLNVEKICTSTISPYISLRKTQKILLDCSNKELLPASLQDTAILVSKKSCNILLSGWERYISPERKILRFLWPDGRGLYQWKIWSKEKGMLSIYCEVISRYGGVLLLCPGGRGSDKKTNLPRIATCGCISKRSFLINPLAYQFFCEANLGPVDPFNPEGPDNPPLKDKLHFMQSRIIPWNLYQLIGAIFLRKENTKVLDKWLKILFTELSAIDPTRYPVSIRRCISALGRCNEYPFLTMFLDRDSSRRFLEMPVIGASAIEILLMEMPDFSKEKLVEEDELLIKTIYLRVSNAKMFENTNCG